MTGHPRGLYDLEPSNITVMAVARGIAEMR
jgi:hypothetical protein